jgi:hypothetical protein
MTGATAAAVPEAAGGAATRGRWGGERGAWSWSVGWRLVVAAVLVVPVERAPDAVQALALVAFVAAVALIGDALAGSLLGGIAGRDRRFAGAVLGIAACVVVGDVIGHCGVLTGAWFRGAVAGLVVASSVVGGGGGGAGAEWLVRWGARRGAPPAGGYPIRARRGRLRAAGSPPPGAPHVVASTIAERELGPTPDLGQSGEGDLGLVAEPVATATTHAEVAARRPSVAGTSWLRSAVQLRAPLRWRRVQQLVLWTAMLLVLVVFARTVVRYRHVPPGRFNYDDTSYHLTAVATWNVHHDLRMPRFTFGDPRTSFYPFSSELLAWELTTPFAGGDFAARWVELPFALLTLVGVAVVARRVGAGEAALLAPLLHATVSEAWPTMTLTAGNDHALAFAAVAAVHGALLLRERPSAGPGVYAGAGLGLLVATKYLGVIYAPLVAVIVVLAVVFSRRQEPAVGNVAWQARRRRFGALLAVAAAASVVGGYAYLRNAVTTGNPIFPVSLQVGGWALPGWPDVTPAAWAKGGEPGFDPWLFPWRMVERFGWLFRFTLLPAALLAPLGALWLVPARRRVLYAGLFAMPLGMYLFFVRLVEDQRGVRYLLPGLAIAAVAAAWLVSRLPPRARFIVSAGLAALAAARWVADLPEALLVLPLAALGVWGWLRRRRPGLAPVWKLVVVGIGAVAVAALAPNTMRRYEEQRFRDRPAAAELERLVGSGPARVAYAGGNQPYLFCGRRLRNALFMPTDTVTTATTFYRWRGPLEGPPARRPRHAWERNLARLGIEWVVWESTGSGIRPEREWMLRSPRRFSRVYADHRAEIWRVRR